MKKIIECPFCDGQANLERKDRDLLYRKENFKVIEHFYKCNTCKEEFTTSESDTITILQAHNQYREKYNIPFTEEIIAIREKYELSAAKMSEVLGLGINGYGNYEKGEIPTPAIGNLIYTADNAEVFKKMLEKAQHYFKEGMYENTLKRISYLIKKQNETNDFCLRLNHYNVPNSLTGFKKPNKEKLAGLLIAFITRCKSEFNDRLKLNKLLFYTDFLSYKLSGFSISGLSYRAIQYGPVPTCYDNIYAYFESEGIIFSKWIKAQDGSAKETFLTEGIFDSQIFSKEEELIIDIITENFKDKASWDLVELSHKEKAWIELQNEKQVVNYQKYAFDLVGI